MTEDKVVLEDWEVEAWEEISKEDKIRFEKDENVLDNVKKSVTPEFFKMIEYEMKESNGGCNFRIINESVGDYDDCIDNINVWVDQMSIGYDGDSYAGTVCVELPDKTYLIWDFSM